MDADGGYERVTPADGEPVRATHGRLMARAREGILGEPADAIEAVPAVPGVDPTGEYGDET